MVAEEEKGLDCGKECFHLICIHLESYPMIIKLFSPCELHLLSFPINFISVSVNTCICAVYCEEKKKNHIIEVFLERWIIGRSESQHTEHIKTANYFV